MKLEHIALLKCIECGGELGISAGHDPDIVNNRMENALLSCAVCGADYPVIGGVGIFFRKDLLCHYLDEREKRICQKLGLNDVQPSPPLNESDMKQLKAARNWGYQWSVSYSFTLDDFNKEGFLNDEVFFRFIPIDRNKIKGKTVVIWCGGKGREAFHIAKHDPRLLIVNEIGTEIHGVRELIRSFDNLLLIRCDMQDNPLKNGIADFSICDHALQHVSDHKKGFKKILDVLNRGGIFAVNVYSFEHNFLMTHVVEPAKLLLHKLPLKIQEKTALVPAMIIYLSIHLFYVPVSKILPWKICRKIPLFDHMMFWSGVTFKWIRCACFDLIHAPISHHFKKSDLTNMAESNNVTIYRLDNVHATTWSMTGEARG